MNEEIEIIDEEQEIDSSSDGVITLRHFFDEKQFGSKTINIPKANIADMFDTETLRKVGQVVVDGYDTDWASMEDWVASVETGREIIKQERSGKSFPWSGASNFKTPMVMQASLKLSDRISMEVFRQSDIVKTTVIGKDEGGKKAERAERVATYQNYQLNVESTEWRDEHLKLIYDLPYHGTEFKKTFYDHALGRNDSVLVTFPNFAVNQAATSIDRLRRFSESISLSRNDQLEREAQGIWIKCREEVPSEIEGDTEAVEHQIEDDGFQLFIEQQCYYDLDGDGYQEPYTITVHKESSSVVRITPRFELEDVLVKSENGIKAESLAKVQSGDYHVVKITAINNITKYGFIHDPQGGFLDVGFYELLGALAASINATTNQLVDAGTLQNLASTTGWLAKGFRKKMGASPMQMGEYKQTGLSAQDLHQGIRPMTAGQPSSVLFTLMQYMISVAQELSASADLSTSLGANAPATTTLALVQEQQQFGGAVILKLYRSMSSEFKKLFVLNSKFLDAEEYQRVLDDPKADFEKDFNLADMDIVPSANPEVSSKIQRIQLAEVEISKIDLIASAGGDPKPVIVNFLKMIGSTNVDEIFPEQNPAELLQALIAKHPELQQMITNEQQRAKMLQQAEAEGIEMQKGFAIAEEQRKDAKLAADLDKTQSETKKNDASTIKLLEEAETENLNNDVTTYTTAVQLNQQAEALDDARQQPRPAAPTAIP